MIKYSRCAGISPLLLSCLTALAIICAATVAAGQPGPEQWRRVQSHDPAFSLDIPADWTFREVEGRGARILPPDRGPVVEVVAWTALRPPATPDTAAVEHEGVLGRVLDYRRDGTEQIETDEGAPAVIATGRVRWRGTTEASIFCAYADGATHYVLGAFAPVEALAELRESVLDRMMSSFRPGAGSAAPPVTEPPPPRPDPDLPPAPRLEPDPDPEPEQVEPPAPITEAQPGDAPATLRVGGDQEPVAPEVREPPAPWIDHRSPLGFSVSIPMDWEVDMIDGAISMTPAVDAAGGLALIWPVTGADPGAEAALQMALTRVGDLRLLRVTATEEIEGATVINATASGGRRLIATWAHDGDFGLLQVAAESERTWGSALPRLARMLVSFTPGQWPVAHRPASDVVGDLDLLRWSLPVGWQVDGGAREVNGEWAIRIEATEPSEDALSVRWVQPVLPRFRALTPLLESLGWRESERYSAPEGGEGLAIYHRRGPEKFVREMLLPRDPAWSRLTAIDAHAPDGAVGDLLQQPNATGQVVIVEGESVVGPRTRIYLAATAQAEPPLSTTCWDAAFLMADAPRGRLAEAVAAIALMVQSARVEDTRRTEQLEPLIRRAQRALTSIPDELRTESGAGLVSVLSDEQPQAARATWSAPDDADSYWSGQADGGRAVNTVGTPVESRAAD